MADIVHKMSIQKKFYKTKLNTLGLFLLNFVTFLVKDLHISPFLTAFYILALITSNFFLKIPKHPSNFFLKIPSGN